MLSLKCKVNFSVVELSMKMVTPIPSLLKNQGGTHTVGSVYYYRERRGSLFLCVCYFPTDSILNLDIKNTVGR